MLEDEVVAALNRETEDIVDWDCPDLFPAKEQAPPALPRDHR